MNYNNLAPGYDDVDYLVYQATKEIREQWKKSMKRLNLPRRWLEPVVLGIPTVTDWYPYPNKCSACCKEI